MRREPLDRTQLQALDGYARVDVVEETGSTNIDLAGLAEQDPAAWPDLSVLTAEYQSAGRGRMDRTWTAPPRSSLFVSVLLRPVNAAGRPLPTQSYSWLSLIAALALVDSLGETAQVGAELKWPNDVLVSGLKLAGLLAQLVPGANGAPPAVVVGSGINVSLEPEELPVPAATSLKIAGAVTLDRTLILSRYLRTLSVYYGAFCAADGDPSVPGPDGRSLLVRISDRMATIGQQVTAQLPAAAELTGVAEGLGPHGELRLRDANGQLHEITAGDIVHLRPWR